MFKGKYGVAKIGVTIALLGFTLIANGSTIIPLDLNDFFADPEVIVSPAGDSAQFVETAVPLVSSVLLSNDPGLGDPEIVQAGIGFVLMFDFNFVEAAGENDGFFAAVLDASGSSAGIDFEAFFDTTSSGTLTIMLDDLILEAFLGLQFELVTFDGGPNSGMGDSTLTISNARLVIPLPGGIWFLLSATVALVGLCRRQR